MALHGRWRGSYKGSPRLCGVESQESGVPGDPVSSEGQSDLGTWRAGDTTGRARALARSELSPGWHLLRVPLPLLPLPSYFCYTDYNSVTVKSPNANFPKTWLVKIHISYNAWATYPIFFSRFLLKPACMILCSLLTPERSGGEGGRGGDQQVLPGTGGGGVVLRKLRGGVNLGLARIPLGRSRPPSLWGSLQLVPGGSKSDSLDPLFLSLRSSHTRWFYSGELFDSIFVSTRGGDIQQMCGGRHVRSQTAWTVGFLDRCSMWRVETVSEVHEFSCWIDW